MKKLLIVLGILAVLGATCSCKEKRCECKYYRTGYATTRSYEPKTGSSCSDTTDWMAADSSGDLIRRICDEVVE
ncbi:MAG: hypothetical protein IJK84_02755 [Bacteroidales bacterium]|nr:hypothetical protein [Bacteroidales bacterium]